MNEWKYHKHRVEVVCGGCTKTTQYDHDLVMTLGRWKGEKCGSWGHRLFKINEIALVMGKDDQELTIHELREYLE